MKKFKVDLTAAELSALEKIRETRITPTIHILFVQALNDHWSARRYSDSGWRREVINLYKKNIKPKFGRLRAGGITPADVKRWHRGMESTPISANRSLAVLARVYSWAESEGLLPPGSNPTTRIAHFKERKRKRVATDTEIKTVGNILIREASEHPAEVAFIFVLMLTGARPRSIEKASLGQLVNGVLTFHGKSTAETGEDESVIVPLFALALLENLDPTRRTLTGIPFPRTFWEKVREEAGCPDLWARDWRRTFATVGLSEGIGFGVMGELLNQRSAQTTKRYALLNDAGRKDAAARICGTITSIITAR